MKLWSGWAHTLRTKPSRRRGEGGGGGGGDDVSEEVGRKKNDEKGAKEETEKEEEEQQGEEEKEGEEEEGEEDGEGEGEEHNTPKLSSSAPRPSNITYSEMSNVGKMVKRIFDQGRVEYLRDLGLRGFQTRYCDANLSPECVMIIATRKSK